MWQICPVMSGQKIKEGRYHRRTNAAPRPQPNQRLPYAKAASFRTDVHVPKALRKHGLLGLHAKTNQVYDMRWETQPTSTRFHMYGAASRQAEAATARQVCLCTSI